MIKKFLFCFILLFFSSNSFALEDIVQGPFKFDNSSIYIKSESDVNYPLSLYLRRNGVGEKIDSYEVNGDMPNVETVFFIRLNKIKSVIVLVSWRQEHRAENISGRLYQVYGYSYSGEKLIPNSKVVGDPNLSGEDGEFNGEELHFKYKDAASIKEYLKSKYY